MVVALPPAAALTICDREGQTPARIAPRSDAVRAYAGEVSRERLGPGRLLPGPCGFVSSLLHIIARSVGEIAGSARINGEAVQC